MDFLKFRNILKITLPIKEAQRFRGKINIQRPRPPHFKRKLEIELTKYMIPIKKLDPIERCIQEKNSKTKSQTEENPYQRIIANECRNWFDHSQMVAIFHCNSMNSADMFKLQVALHKSNMCAKKYGRDIMKTAFENTGYTALLPLFQSPNLIVFSPDVQVGKLIKIAKKIRQIILLVGIIDDRLLHKDDFVNYSKLPDLQTARAQFAQLLSSGASGIVSQLNQHQSTLLHNLESRKEQLQEKEK